MFVKHAGAGASGTGGKSDCGMVMSTPPAAGSTAAHHRFVHACGSRLRLKKMSSASPDITVLVGYAAESVTPLVPQAMPVSDSPVSAAGERTGAPPDTCERDDAAAER